MAPFREEAMIEPKTKTRYKGFGFLFPRIIRKAPINLKLENRKKTNPSSDPK